MGVIPLELTKTVVDSRHIFDAGGGLSGRVVLIQNIERDQLTDHSEANATYDLRVGPEYRYLNHSQKHELPPNQQQAKIVLKKGESVLVLTEEQIYLPQSIFGVVVTKVGIVQQGASNPPSKVDPGYDGPLIVTVTNLGKEPVTLTRGQRFCSIFFLRMEDDAKPYDKASKRIIGSAKQTRKRHVGEIVEQHAVGLLSLNLAATLLIFLLIALIYLLAIR